MKNLVITVPAINDLEEIWNFIADESVGAADRVEAEFREEMEKLCANPGIGHERNDVKNKTLRFWPVYSYVIAYRVEGDSLYVWRVVHGARNFRRLFPKRGRSK